MKTEDCVGENNKVSPWELIEEAPDELYEFLGQNDERSSYLYEKYIENWQG